ncbi:MAG: NADH-quinone oxidoreductase subunit M, partial [Gammaproteobacteria bacterium]
MSALPLLSLVTWIPILGGIAVLVARREALARPLALGFALVTFLLSLPLYTGFDLHTPAMQFVEKAAWIERFNVFYHLGVDGISMPLILLNTFTTVLVILAGWKVITYKPAQYMAAFLIMEGFINGVFAA